MFLIVSDIFLLYSDCLIHESSLVSNFRSIFEFYLFLCFYVQEVLRKDAIRFTEISNNTTVVIISEQS